MVPLPGYNNHRHQDLNKQTNKQNNQPATKLDNHVLKTNGTAKSNFR